MEIIYRLLIPEPLRFNIRQHCWPTHHEVEGQPAGRLAGALKNRIRIAKDTRRINFS